MSDKVSLILHDLELEALRTRFQLFEPAFRDFRNSNGPLWFELDDYEIAYSPGEEQTQFLEAQSLNREPRIVRRRIELAADGIWPTVVAYNEFGNARLTVVVKFGARGRRVLERTGPSFSPVVRWLLSIFRSSYLVLGIALVSAVLVERVYRQGWVSTFAILGAVTASCALSIWFLRRRKA